MEVFFQNNFQNMTIFDQSDIKYISSFHTSGQFRGYKFHTSNDDVILYNMEKFVMNTIKYNNPNQVLPLVKEYFDKIQLLNENSLSKSSKNSEVKISTKSKLSMRKLINKKLIPIFFTTADEINIIALKDKQFITFFKNEICCLLNYIEWYKEVDVEFELPKDIDVLKKQIIIDKNTFIPKALNDKLENIFQRIVLIYSTIIAYNFGTHKYRIGLLKELTFLKLALYMLTSEMDKHHMRIENFKKFFIENYPKNRLGYIPKIWLDDIVKRPYSEFIVFGDLVSKYLYNLSS